MGSRVCLQRQMFNDSISGIPHKYRSLICLEHKFYQKRKKPALLFQNWSQHTNFCVFFFPSLLYYCRGFRRNIKCFCYFSNSLGMDVGCLQLLMFVGKLAIIPHTELICHCLKNSGKVPKPAKLFRDTI